MKLDATQILVENINPEIQMLVWKLFEKLEATKELKATEPEAYFQKSNTILMALTACIIQRALTDGLPRHKVGYRLSEGIAVGWEMFLDANPEIAKKVAAEKAVKEAQLAAMQDETDEENQDAEDENDDEQ